MPYIVKPDGITITDTVGTFPQYQTLSGGAVVTDSVNAKVILVDNWPHNEHDTQDIIDTNGGYIFLPNDVVAKIMGIVFAGDGTNANTFKISISLDVASSGSAADFRYILNKDALQTWDVKITNIGNVNVSINGAFPILPNQSSVFRKAQYIRPVVIDATNLGSAVASNAVI